MKIKSIVRDGRNVVTLKMDNDCPTNMREYNLLMGKGMSGLMRITYSKRRQFEYAGPLSIPVADRFAMPISLNEFLFVAAQVADISERMQKNGFSVCNLVLNPSYVYISGATKQIQFLYIPVMSNGGFVDMRQFLGALLALARFETREASQKATEFGRFLAELQSFDSAKVLEYIKGVDPEIAGQLKKTNFGSSGFLTDDRREQYNHYNTPNTNTASTSSYAPTPQPVQQSSAQTVFTPQSFGGSQWQSPANTAPAREYSGGRQEEYEATGLLREGYDATGLLREEYDATGLLKEEPAPMNGGFEQSAFGGGMGGSMPADEYETTFLDESATYSRNGRGQARTYPKLKRMLTGETVDINKPVFRIGKERSYVDYFIADNNAISRSHADIITRGNKYYIVDKNSKNRTFVNEEPIPVGVEIEINEKTRLRLANEEFSFIAG